MELILCLLTRFDDQNSLQLCPHSKHLAQTSPDQRGQLTAAQSFAVIRPKRLRRHDPVRPAHAPEIHFEAAKAARARSPRNADVLLLQQVSIPLLHCLGWRQAELHEISVAQKRRRSSSVTGAADEDHVSPHNKLFPAFQNRI